MQPTSDYALGKVEWFKALRVAYRNGYRDVMTSHNTRTLLGRLFARLLVDSVLSTAAVIISIVAYFSMLFSSPLMWLYKGGGLKKMMLLQRSLLLESLALFTAVSTFGIQKKHYAPQSTADHDKPLVVMIHGLLHNAAAWHYHADALSEQGYDVLCLNWGGLTKSIDDAAQRIAAELQEAVPNDKRSIVFVGHSTGYRIAHQLLADNPREGRFKAYVALAGPTEGTHLASLANILPTTCINGMTPKQSPHPAIEGRKVYLVDTTYDYVILPSKEKLAEHTADADNVVRKTYYAGGHLSLLYCPQATAEIIEALKHSRLVVPNALCAAEREGTLDLLV